MTDVPNTNEIGVFFHCGGCLPDKPPDVSPAEFSALDVGWTKLGMQVWCRRCNVNVIHIDFEGMSHLANTTRAST